MGRDKPKYRLCWWCNKQLRGPYGRVITFKGPLEVIVHANCAPEAIKGHEDVSITCVPGCPCRRHKRAYEVALDRMKS